MLAACIQLLGSELCVRRAWRMLSAENEPDLAASRRKAGSPDGAPLSPRAAAKSYHHLHFSSMIEAIFLQYRELTGICHTFYDYC